MRRPHWTGSPLPCVDSRDEARNRRRNDEQRISVRERPAGVDEVKNRQSCGSEGAGHEDRVDPDPEFPRASESSSSPHVGRYREIGQEAGYPNGGSTYLR